MARIELSAIRKSFDATDVLKGVDLTIEDGEFVSLVGPSGCGKSTLLRIIAGLEPQTSGAVTIGGQPVDGVRPSQRNLAMVFQSYALYPHLSVYDNIAVPLRMKRLSTLERLPALGRLLPNRHRIEREIRGEVERVAAQLELSAYLKRKPGQLSGGQRQRVAMGRAIVRNPKVFLFDEPLSNLDAQLRVQMRFEIKRVHQKVRTTTVYVTHDQVEAMTLADRVVVMNNGRIEQVGTPNELYHRPATRFVAGFIGSPSMNFIPCTLEDNAGRLQIRLSDTLAMPVPEQKAAHYRGLARDKKLQLGIRPEHIADARATLEPGVAAFDALLDITEPMGMETLIYFNLNGSEVCGRVSPNAGARDGGMLRLAVDLNNMHLIDEGTGLVI